MTVYELMYVLRSPEYFNIKVFDDNTGELLCSKVASEIPFDDYEVVGIDPPEGDTLCVYIDYQ